MLKAPYEHIHTKGSNRYYILNIDDLKYAFLANESVENIDQETHRLIGKPKVKKTELLQSLRLMPISSHILFLLKKFIEIPFIEEIDKGGVETQNIYGTWEEIDILELQNEYKNIIERAGGLSKWGFPKTIRNNVARAFATKGHIYFGTEKDGSFKHNYWLLRASKMGVLKITNVVEVGLHDDTITSVVDTYLIDRDLAQAVIDYYKTNETVLVDDKMPDLPKKENEDK
jgi:hypothetical protein